MFGLLPSLAFFAWVERNASLPRVGIELGWPWISLQTWPTPMLVAWNSALVLAFGVIHSLLAQKGPREWLGQILPPQTLRAFYVVVTGLSLTALMGLWQNTGVILWLLPLSPFLILALSLILFWGLMSLTGWVMKRFDALEFVGLKQLYSSQAELERPQNQPRLMTSGIYGRVRHPIYTFTSMAFILTPFMTLDRMVLCGAMGLYLSWAIPLEERKLIALFGTAYKQYRTQVPAVLPRLWR
jgi:protein-S-isoprenylcysteine O-methyltransferase Ste14